MSNESQLTVSGPSIKKFKYKGNGNGHFITVDLSDEQTIALSKKDGHKMKAIIQDKESHRSKCEIVEHKNCDATLDTKVEYCKISVKPKGFTEDESKYYRITIKRKDESLGLGLDEVDPTTTVTIGEP